MLNARQELMSLKAKLRVDVETFKEQYEKAEADYNVVVRALELLEFQDSGVPLMEQPRILARDIDFTGTQNLPERLERIADRCNGLVNITKAAEILIEVKQSRSKKTNLRSMIYRTLSENSNSWEKVAPGTFKRWSGQIVEAKGEGTQPDFLILPPPGP